MRAVALAVAVLLLPLALAAGEEKRVSREELLRLPPDRSWKLPAQPGVRYRLRGVGDGVREDGRLRPGKRGLRYEVSVERRSRPNVEVEASGPLRKKGVGVEVEVRY